MSETPAKTDKSLKASNFKWHVGLAVTDAILLAVFVAPELVRDATTTQIGLARAASTVVAPILVLLLMNVLSSNMKAMLVYWKPLGWLPGCEAFTKYGPSDPRVDMDKLKEHGGESSEEPAKQNSKWYALYKQVESITEVASAQKDFLMYRDMAVLSLPLIVLVPLGLYIADASTKAMAISAGLLFLQYLLTAISARHAGERFVCNVLAVHSSRKVGEVHARAAKMMTKAKPEGSA